MSPVSPFIIHRLMTYLISTGMALLSQLTLSQESDAPPVPLPPSNLLTPIDEDGPSKHQAEETKQAGLLIINADDWGRDRETTDCIYHCLVRKTVSSVSAMVFMEDSERAAAMARADNVDAGLHINLTSPFTAPNSPPELARRQQELASHLMGHRLARAMFYPRLMQSFQYVVNTQIDEFTRLYGKAPERYDGHHHMHLCGNIVLGGLLPSGTIVRRNFSFQPGEKSWGNRLYRQGMDRMLARNHKVVDFFYSLPPLEPADRLRRIFSLSNQFVIEVETHPVNREEYRLLAEGEIFRQFGDMIIAPRFGGPR